MRCVWCAAIITSKPYEVAELNPFVDPAGDQKLEGNQPQAPSAIDATDAARELAAENGIDLAAIEGTGKDGLITVGDVRKAIAEAKG
jgi:pyruvate/2-oxoglutarate dehydrogenase complex dihydrolipoamide acyltransferase (E2) component